MSPFLKWSLKIPPLELETPSSGSHINHGSNNTEVHCAVIFYFASLLNREWPSEWWSPSLWLLWRQRAPFLGYNEPVILVGSEGWQGKWRGVSRVVKLDPFFRLSRANPFHVSACRMALFGGWVHLSKADVWPVGGSGSACLVLPLPSMLARSAHRLWPSESSLPLWQDPSILHPYRDFCPRREEDFLAEEEIAFPPRSLQESICCLFFWHFCLVLSGIMKDGVYLQWLWTPWVSGRLAPDYALKEETKLNLTKFSTSEHSAWPIAINQQMPSFTQTIRVRCLLPALRVIASYHIAGFLPYPGSIGSMCSRTYHCMAPESFHPEKK